MAKQKINELEQGVRVTSYLQDNDENNDIFYRICIFFTDSVEGEMALQLNKFESADLLTIENDEFFVNTEEIEAKIENYKELMKQARGNG